MELLNVLIFVLLGVMLGGSLVFISLHRAHRRSLSELSDKLSALERGLADRGTAARAPEPARGAEQRAQIDPIRAQPASSRSGPRETSPLETPATEATRHGPMMPSASALSSTSPTANEPDPALGPAFIPLPRVTAAHTPAVVASRSPVPSPAGGSPANTHPSGPNVLPANPRAAPPQRLQNMTPSTPLAMPDAPTAASSPVPSAAAVRAATAAAAVPSKPPYPPVVPGSLVAPPMPGLTPPEEPSPIRLSIPPLAEAYAQPTAAQMPVHGSVGVIQAPPSNPTKRSSAASSFAAGPIPAPRSTQEPSTLVEFVRDQDPELSRLIASSRARLEPAQQSPPPSRLDPSVTEMLPRARRPVRADDEVTQLDPLEPSMLAMLQGGPEPAFVHAVEPSGPKRVFEEPALPARVAANGEIVRGAEARTRVTEIESNAEPHATSDAWVWAPPPEIDSMLGEFARGVDDPATTSPRHVLPELGSSWAPKKT